MTRFKYLLITAIFFASNSTFGQQIHALKIGDTLPAITLEKIIDKGKVVSGNTLDYRGKFLIIDFWATWCSPCIGAMPFLDSLKREFGDKLEILSVSDQNETIVSQFLKRMKTEKNISPKSVVEDRHLNQLFPHNAIPFFVWIDPNGKVIATTEEDQLTREKVEKLISAEKVNFKMRADAKYLKRQPTRSLFTLSNKLEKIQELITQEVPDSSILFQSIFTRYIPKIKSVLNWDSSGFKAINSELSMLIRTVFNLTYYPNYTSKFYNAARFKIEISDNKLLKKVRDTTISPGIDYVEWLKKNGVCYEIAWENARTWKQRFQMLNEDMNRYIYIPMGLKAQVEKRPMISYVLKVTKRGLIEKSNGGQAIEKYDAYSYKLKNMVLFKLINRMQGYYYQRSPIPIIDESGIKFPIDLDLEGKISSIDVLNENLSKYGLKFIKAYRNEDVLIITDRK